MIFDVFHKVHIRRKCALKWVLRFEQEIGASSKFCNRQEASFLVFLENLTHKAGKLDHNSTV